MRYTSYSQGARWRIENGRKIQVYKDNWILRPDFVKPIFVPTMPENAITDLIYSENQWNVDLVE